RQGKPVPLINREPDHRCVRSAIEKQGRNDRMSEVKERASPQRVQNPNAAAVRVAFDPLRPTEKPQDYYDDIKRKFAEARDLRLSYRPDGRAQYTSDLTGEL